MSNASNIFKTIFINNNITRYNLIVFLILLVLLYIIIFHIFIKFKDFHIVQKLDQICFLSCNNNLCTKYTQKTRGKTYYLTNENDAYNCLFTIWEFYHIIMHIFIGYFLDLRYSLLVGIPFEVFEYIKYDCENYMDVFYNTLGAVIGGILRYNFKK